MRQLTLVVVALFGFISTACVSQQDFNRFRDENNARLDKLEKQPPPTPTPPTASAPMPRFLYQGILAAGSSQPSTQQALTYGPEAGAITITSLGQVGGAGSNRRRRLLEFTHSIAGATVSVNGGSNNEYPLGWTGAGDRRIVVEDGVNGDVAFLVLKY